jgi:hypothetical protein
MGRDNRGAENDFAGGPISERRGFERDEVGLRERPKKMVAKSCSGEL